MPSVFYDCSAARLSWIQFWVARAGVSFTWAMANIWARKQNGKAFAFPQEGAPECLIGIQWGASVPISSLACYPIPCLVSSPLYFTFLLLLSSNVVCLSYCFRYYYSISVVIICCFYVLLHSVFLLFLVVIILFHFLLSIVVIFNFFTLFIICCCY